MSLLPGPGPVAEAEAEAGYLLSIYDKLVNSILRIIVLEITLEKLLASPFLMLTIKTIARLDLINSQLSSAQLRYT